MSSCPLNFFVSKTFVIHLECRVDRLEEIRDECKRVGMDFELFSATSGRVCEGVVLLEHPEGKETRSMVPNAEHAHCWTAGNMGLIHTMIRLLERCSLDPDIESILVVEDDAQFVLGFNVVLEDNLKHVPGDWEMVFMGMTRNLPGEIVGGNIIRVPHKGGYAAHCVAIRRTIFPLLIELFSMYREPNDVTYSDRVFSRGRTYAFCPNIAFQRPGYSSILQEFTDYDHLRRQ